MKIDFTQNLKTLGDTAMKDVDERGEAIDATLKMAAVNALLAPQKDGETGVEKIKKYELAKMIFKAEGEIDVTADEVVMIKKAADKAFPSPMIVGQINEMLEK